MKIIKIFMLLICSLIFVNTSWGQVEGTERRYLRLGELQHFYSAYGTERAWNNVYYEGLMWPADYTKQDNFVIQRAWVGCEEFTDQYNEYWSHYCSMFLIDYVGRSLFPVELKETAKFERPPVYVTTANGLTDITQPYRADVDELNEDQPSDLMISNVINTYMGVTVTRRLYKFSQQYHDNYIIREIVIKNTGNTDYDDDIELNATVKGFRLSWAIRYSLGRRGAELVSGGQVWGQNSWVTRRGEDYASHVGEAITETNPIVDWLRCAFSWIGQNSANSYDNWGGPDLTTNGMLYGPQHAGIVTLHVDKSASDKSDDPDQPVCLGWHSGDDYASTGDLTDITQMDKAYSYISGNPYPDASKGGTDRFYEKYHATNPSPWTVHGNGGGTNIWFCYGPFDLAPGDSVTIIEAEAVAGLSRQECERVGIRWKKAKDDTSDKGPFILPDGLTTDDKDIFKNDWVSTGVDSIMQTFGRAKRNFDLNYQIPQPPSPPSFFKVESGGDRISISWGDSPDNQNPDFAGYRLFRAVGKPDTTYEMVFECDPSVTEYSDVSAIRGFSYYYYIVAFTHGADNATGQANPTGELVSNRFYTKTTEGVYLLRAEGDALDDIRIVPNPYHIRARNMQYPGEQDKIMFLNIPGHCTIRIFTPNGDLVQTIHHEDGSGDQTWNSVTSSRQVVVSGVYLVHVEVTQDSHDERGNIKFRKGDTIIKRMIIIR